MTLTLFLRYFLEFSVLFPSALFAFMPVFDYFKYDVDKVLLQALVAILACSLVGSLLCALFSLTTNTLLLPMVLLFFIAYVRVVNLNLGQAAFCFANAMLIPAFCSMYTNVLMAWHEASNDAPVLYGTSSCVLLLLTAPCCLIFWKTLTRRVPDVMENSYLRKVWRWAFLFPLGVTALMWWAMPVDVSILLAGRIRMILIVILPIVLLAVLALYMLVHWVARHMAEGAKLEQDNQLLRMEERRYLELKGYMEDTRTQRHDFRQHLRVISALSAKGQLDELNAYLSRYEGSVGEEHRQYCQNAAVDAIAAYYDHMAAQQQARVRWTLALPAQTDLEETDLCVIVGNLIENALNAMQALPPEQREMTVIVKKLSEAMTGVTVENPYAGTLRYDAHGLPMSDRLGHGVGLSSVTAIAAKYRGSVSIDTKEGTFSISVLLFS